MDAANGRENFFSFLSGRAFECVVIQFRNEANRGEWKCEKRTELVRAERREERQAVLCTLFLSFSSLLGFRLAHSDDAKTRPGIVSCKHIFAFLHILLSTDSRTKSHGCSFAPLFAALFISFSLAFPRPRARPSLVRTASVRRATRILPREEMKRRKRKTVNSFCLGFASLSQRRSAQYALQFNFISRIAEMENAEIKVQ